MTHSPKCDVVKYPTIAQACTCHADAEDWCEKVGLKSIQHSLDNGLICLPQLLEAYASSQSEKLAGVGQQAAEEIQNVGNLHMEWGDQTYVEVAEIIDRVIAGRVKP